MDPEPDLVGHQLGLNGSEHKPVQTGQTNLTPGDRLTTIWQTISRPDGAWPNDGAGRQSPIEVIPGYTYIGDPVNSKFMDDLYTKTGLYLQNKNWRDKLTSATITNDWEALTLQSDVSESFLLDARELFSTIYGRELSTSIVDGQPFRLSLLHELACITNDVDKDFPLECIKGVNNYCKKLLCCSFY